MLSVRPKSALPGGVSLLLALGGCGGNPFAALPAPEPATPSVSTLSTPTTPTATGSIECHEVEVRENGSTLGNGFAFQDGKIHYDATNDTFTIDNLALDGGNVYSRNRAVDGVLPTGVKAFAAASTYADDKTGAVINQFSSRALYGESATGRSRFSILRTGAYMPYGFGGFFYAREGGVTIPKSGQALQSGRYVALRDADGLPFDGKKLTYVLGDMQMAVDFDDFNDTSGAPDSGNDIRGAVSGRHIYDLNGTDITVSVLGQMNKDHGLEDRPMTELPVLVFKVGPGYMDAHGEMEGEVSSLVPTKDGGAKVFEEGKYYALLSGVIVATGDVAGVTMRETGGFILYRP